MATKAVSGLLALALAITMCPAAGLAYAAEGESSQQDQSSTTNTDRVNQDVQLDTSASGGSDGDSEASTVPGDTVGVGSSAADTTSEEGDGSNSDSASASASAKYTNSMNGQTSADVSLNGAATVGTIEYNGLAYTIDTEDSTKVAVTGLASTKPSGDVQIPAQIANGGELYTVAGIRVPGLSESINPYAESLFDSKAKALAVNSISVPASVTKIDSAFFQLFPNATDINVAADNAAYTSYDGALYSADLTQLILVPQGRGSLVLPQSLAAVPAYVLSQCNKLSAISFPGSTGNDTFAVWNNVLYTSDFTTLLAAPAGLGASATIAAECTTIAEGAFYGNSALETIVVNGVVEGIAKAGDVAEGEEGEALLLNSKFNAGTATLPAFNDSTVSTATIVLNVAVGSSAAYGTSEEGEDGEYDDAGDSSVILSEAKDLSAIDDAYAALLEKAKSAWVEYGFQNFKEPATPGTEIAPTEGAGFAFTLLPDYTLSVRWKGEMAEPPAALDIPDYGIIDGVQYTVSTIADNGFSNYTSIITADLPQTITTIGNSAFSGATNLQTIHFDSVVTIGELAFSNTALLSLILPSTVQTIGDNAFSNMKETTVVALGSIANNSPIALGAAAGLDVYVPMGTEDNWDAGIPTLGNHIYPYGVQLSQEPLELEVGQTANILDGGYIEAPGNIETNYAYKANPISINTETGEVEGKAKGGSNIEVSLSIGLSEVVVSHNINDAKKLTPVSWFAEKAYADQSIVGIQKNLMLGSDSIVFSIKEAPLSQQISANAAGDPFTLNIHSTAKTTIDIMNYKYEGNPGSSPATLKSVATHTIEAGGSFGVNDVLYWQANKSNNDVRQYIWMKYDASSEYDYADIAISSYENTLAGFKVSAQDNAEILQLPHAWLGYYEGQGVNSDVQYGSDVYVAWESYPVTFHSDVNATMRVIRYDSIDLSNRNELSNNSYTINSENPVTLNEVMRYAVWQSNWGYTNNNGWYACAYYADGGYADIFIEATGGMFTGFSPTKGEPAIATNTEIPALKGQDLYCNWASFPLKIYSDVACTVSTNYHKANADGSTYFDHTETFSLNRDNVYTMPNISNYDMAKGTYYDGVYYIWAELADKSTYHYVDIVFSVDGGVVEGGSFTRFGDINTVRNGCREDSVYLRWESFPLVFHSPVSCTVTQRDFAAGGASVDQKPNTTLDPYNNYVIKFVNRIIVQSPNVYYDGQIYISYGLAANTGFEWGDLLINYDPANGIESGAGAGNGVSGYSTSEFGPMVGQNTNMFRDNDEYGISEVWVRWASQNITFHTTVACTIKTYDHFYRYGAEHPWEFLQSRTQKVPAGGTFIINAEAGKYANVTQQADPNGIFRGKNYISYQWKTQSDGHYYSDIGIEADDGSFMGFGPNAEGTELFEANYSLMDNNIHDVYAKWNTAPLTIRSDIDAYVEIQSRHYSTQDGVPIYTLLRTDTVRIPAGGSYTVKGIKEWWTAYSGAAYPFNDPYLCARTSEPDENGFYYYYDILVHSGDMPVAGYSLSQAGELLPAPGAGSHINSNSSLPTGDIWCRWNIRPFTISSPIACTLVLKHKHYDGSTNTYTEIETKEVDIPANGSYTLSGRETFSIADNPAVFPEGYSKYLNIHMRWDDTPGANWVDYYDIGVKHNGNDFAGFSATKDGAAMYPSSNLRNNSVWLKWNSFALTVSTPVACTMVVEERYQDLATGSYNIIETKRYDVAAGGSISVPGIQYWHPARRIDDPNSKWVYGYRSEDSARKYYVDIRWECPGGELGGYSVSRGGSLIPFDGGENVAEGNRWAKASTNPQVWLRWASWPMHVVSDVPFKVDISTYGSPGRVVDASGSDLVSGQTYSEFTMYNTTSWFFNTSIGIQGKRTRDTFARNRMARPTGETF